MRHLTRYSLLYLTLLMLMSSSLFAQKILTLSERNFIGAYPITVSFNKTSHLIFPYQIVYVDLGSEDIIAEKVEKVENILKLKGNAANFPQTNLTVILADGKYYSFLVSYEEKPRELSVIITDQLEREKPTPAPESSASRRKVATFENISYTYPELESFSRTIFSKRRSINNIGAVRQDIFVSLNSLYIRENAFFFHIEIKNRSDINYDIDFIKFYIRDKAVSKRTVRQQLEITPVFSVDRMLRGSAPEPGSQNMNERQIKAQSSLERMFVLEKFTIPGNKILEIEFFEKKGGRHLTFPVSDINNARLLK